MSYSLFMAFQDGLFSRKNDSAILRNDTLNPLNHIIFHDSKKTLDSRVIKSIIRFFFVASKQEVIMTSEANYRDTADLVNIHIPVT